MSFRPRYILAEEAEQRIVALYRKEKGDAAEIFNTAVDACQSIILDMYDNSSEDVAPVKHGRWIVVSDGYGNGDATAHICECSECKDTIWVYKKATRRWNYCPNCGAKMDLGGEAHEQN